MYIMNSELCLAQSKHYVCESLLLFFLCSFICTSQYTVDEASGFLHPLLLPPPQYNYVGKLGEAERLAIVGFVIKDRKIII